jgi:two-component system, sensor histidine kinase PdtaS
MIEQKLGIFGRARAQSVATIGSSDSVEIDDAQFRSLVENIPTLCWMANADGSIFWYNRRWHDYCGSTPEQMAGWGWQSVHDPEILPSVLERWTGCIAAGTFFEMTFPLRGADGIFRPFLTRVEPVRDAGGAIKWWFGANVDVTAQVAAETELREANRKNQAIAAEREAILSQLSEGVIVTDLLGRITFVNQAASRLHGVATLDVEPDGYADAYSLWTEDGLPHPADSLPLTRAVRNQETVVDARWKIRRPDGTEVLALGNAKPIFADDGSAIGAVLTIRDDTLRHATEEAMAQAVVIKDVMLQEVNHRVKNNLQLVTSLLSLQAERTTLAEVRTSLLEARSRLVVIAAMHQRLYATTQTERVELSSYLHELAKETIAALRGERSVHLSFTADAECSVTLDDAVPLALVLNELLTNAMKYAFGDRKGGRIAIRILQEDGQLCIFLNDNGCGLPASFNPTSAKGLGMMIVTALIGQVEGKLTIGPRASGTEFMITIPLERLRQSGHDD